MIDLGLPSPGEIKSCLAGDKKAVRMLFRHFMAGGLLPFNIVISEKVMPSWIPPLCEVRTEQDIRWRERDGKFRSLNQAEVLTELAVFADDTWFEFIPIIWGGNNIAGRLSYIDPKEQLLEIQEGVKPAQLVQRGFALFTGSLTYFDIQGQDYRERARELSQASYNQIIPLHRVKMVADWLFPKMDAFEYLKQLSPMPTYEFAYLTSGQMISIDIDWPRQWIEGGNENGNRAFNACG